MENTPSLYICVDGIDGCGKTTIVNIITNHLSELGRPTIKFKAMGEGPIGTQVRKRMMEGSTGVSGFAEAYYAMSGQIEVLEDYIVPTLESGADVVCDRYLGSYFSYQIKGNCNETAAGIFYDVNKVFKRIRQPDLYIYCDVDLDVGAKRVESRGIENAFDTKPKDYMKRVAEGYRQYFLEYTGHKVEIDCNASMEEVKEEVIKAVDRLFLKR